MNIAALRAVPRRSWWTLAGVTIIVCAFAADRDLGATALIVFLTVWFAATGLRGSMRHRHRASHHGATISSPGMSVADADGTFWSAWPLNDLDCDSLRSESPAISSHFASLDDWQQSTMRDDWQLNIINPATGCSMDSYAGIDSGGCFYGESHTHQSGER